jgi:mono/diheme cytochrome c family protein
MKILKTIAAFSFAAFLAAPPLAAQALQGDVAEGARVYGNTCGSCHNARSPLERTDREWVVIINHMRMRGNLTGGQVRDVLAFLQATNGDLEPGQMLAAPAPEPVVDAISNEISIDPAVIALGAELVTQKACVGCHVIGDVGGAVGPGLNNVFDSRDAAYVRRKLADPTFDNPTSMMPSFGLSEESIDALVAYLASLNRP